MEEKGLGKTSPLTVSQNIISINLVKLLPISIEYNKILVVVDKSSKMLWYILIIINITSKNHNLYQASWKNSINKSELNKIP